MKVDKEKHNFHFIFVFILINLFIICCELTGGDLDKRVENIVSFPTPCLRRAQEKEELFVGLEGGCSRPRGRGPEAGTLALDLFEKEEEIIIQLLVNSLLQPWNRMPEEETEGTRHAPRLVKAVPLFSYHRELEKDLQQRALD